MKFFVAIALFAAVASARILPADLNLTPSELAEVEQIMAAIYSPSTDPTTAVMLEQMLFDLLGISSVQAPIHLPATIDQFEPVHLGPEFIDFPLLEGAIAPTPVAPVAPAPPASVSSPLVQIIVNVKDQGASPSPVQVDQPSLVDVVHKPKPPVIKPTPVHVVDDIGEVVIKPTPVHVVDDIGEVVIKPTPVIVVDDAFETKPEPVLIGNLPETVAVSPIMVAPAVVGPEILN